MTNMETQVFRTSDMALATYLRAQGYDVQEVSLDEGRTCWWYFVQSSSLLDLVEAFRLGTASIEPKEYNRLFGVTKREFFSLTDNDEDHFNRR